MTQDASKKRDQENGRQKWRKTMLILPLAAAVALSIMLLSRDFPELVASPRSVPNIHKYSVQDIKPENASCLDCHKVAQPSAGDPSLKESIRSVCLACHEEKKSLLAMEGKHFPFAQGDCTLCHLVHRSEEKGLMKGPLGEMCTTCHADQKAEQQLSFPHRPFSDGFCGSCHNPHASAIKGLLRMSPKELCTGCHQKMVLAAEAKALVHPPFSTGNCTGCHSPHGSQTVWLLKGQVKDLCLDCHKGESLGGLAHWGHRPFEVGDCGSCHELHSSDHERLLRLPGALMCLTCHRRQA